MESASKDTTKQLEELISTGRLIIRGSNEISAQDNYGGKFVAVNMHKDYLIWKFKVRDFLYSIRRLKDARIFALDDSVPLLKGGLDYSDPLSKESQKLLKCIRSEATKKVKFLIDILDRLIPESKDVISKVDGVFRMNGDPLPFKKGAIYTLVFEYLFNTPDRFASYKDINNYLLKNSKKYKLSKANISSRIRGAVRTYDSNKGLPKKIKGKKVLKVIKGVGIELNI